MFELSKQKRLQIVSQIGDKRERLASNERRRLVEDEYNQFIKTMNNIKSSTVKINDANNSQQNIKTSEPSQQAIRASLHFSISPSVNDIPKPPTDRDSLHQQFYQTANLSQSPKKLDSPVKMNQMNFYKISPAYKQKAIQQNLNQLKEEKSLNHSLNKIQDQEIKFVVNPSVQPSSVNSSEAIFFTSQFKDYINKQNSPPKDQNQQKIEESYKKQVHEAKIQQKQSFNNNVETQKHEERILMNNPSGQSLALSNDSSLKFSLHESAVHEAIAHKLKKQLVIESIGDSKKFITFRQLTFTLLMKENFKDFIQFGKQLRLISSINQNKKKKVFLELMVRHQLLFQQRKNEIKVNHHKKNIQELRLRACFQQWKNYSQAKKEALQSFIDKSKQKQLQKLFRAFKMLLFDRKITNQINLYYLSKVFFAFKSVTQKQSKRNEQKAYRFYFKHLKRKMFQLLVEGVRIRLRERQLNELANQQYYFSLLRRVFQCWKEKSPRQQRYIRLAMTTKNQLKETLDKRLFQTQTFDFKEIR